MEIALDAVRGSQFLHRAIPVFICLRSDSGIMEQPLQDVTRLGYIRMFDVVRTVSGSAKPPICVRYGLFVAIRWFLMCSGRNSSVAKSLCSDIYPCSKWCGKHEAGD